MKIKIVNFGPIKEFEFDLSKKLIVTYGDNNILSLIHISEPTRPY